jgi:hypothetical protein
VVRTSRGAECQLLQNQRYGFGSTAPVTSAGNDHHRSIPAVGGARRNAGTGAINDRTTNPGSAEALVSARSERHRFDEALAVGLVSVCGARSNYCSHRFFGGEMAPRASGSQLFCASRDKGVDDFEFVPSVHAADACGTTGLSENLCAHAGPRVSPADRYRDGPRVEHHRFAGQAPHTLTVG